MCTTTPVCIKLLKNDLFIVKLWPRLYVVFWSHGCIRSRSTLLLSFRPQKVLALSMQMHGFNPSFLSVAYSYGLDDSRNLLY